MEHFCKIRAVDILKNNAAPILTVCLMGAFSIWIKSVTPDGMMIDFATIFVSALVYFGFMFVFARKDFMSIFVF